MEELHIGLDDFDSYNGGCTTHLATFLSYALMVRYGAKLLDLPHLVRLNPSIPWKTRGNGAVAIHVAVPSSLVDEVVNYVVSFAKRYSQVFRGPDQEPGIAIVVGDVPRGLSGLYHLAVSDYVAIDYVLELIRKFSGRVLVFGKRGIVGALAALSWWLDGRDHTYELLVYRVPSSRGPRRCIDESSVLGFDARHRDCTFNTLDYTRDDRPRILIAPHGPDPVLYGVRGDCLGDILAALKEIRCCEPIDAWAVFRTNQGTDDHAVARRVSELKPFRTGRVSLTIAQPPVAVPGGHVVFTACDSTGCIRLAFFRQTGLNRVASRLIPGDRISVIGSVKLWDDGLPTFHVEKLYVESLAKLCVELPPICPICGASMESLGRGKGYRCRRCGFRTKDVSKRRACLPRLVSRGLYAPPPSAMKHLTKPPSRIGREKLYIRRIPLDLGSPYLNVRDVEGLLQALQA
ncbi:MAG: DNA-binding protein [Thermoprotei archaeon]|nr:MAG: DNA-binding protein [Thermoprotei archaeon]